MALDSIIRFSADIGSACSAGDKGLTLLPTWYQYLPQKQDAFGSCAPSVTFPDDIGAILLALVDILLRLGAIAAVGFVIYGAFMFITSQGEPDKAKNARHTIINALVGLVITLVATGAVSFIGGQLLK